MIHSIISYDATIAILSCLVYDNLSCISKLFSNSSRDKDDIYWLIIVDVKNVQTYVTLNK